MDSTGYAKAGKWAVSRLQADRLVNAAKEHFVAHRVPVGIQPAIFGQTGRSWHTSELSATFRSTRHRLIWECISLGFACLLGGALCFRYVHMLSFWRCTVVNTNNAYLINERGGGPRQNPRAIGVLRFRRRLAPLLMPDWKTLDTIIALRHWARTQQPSDRQLWRFPPDADSGDVDPGILLQQQHALTPGACRRFGYVLAGALVSVGIPARLVSLQALFTDGSGHIMVEAWVDDLNKWSGLICVSNDGRIYRAPGTLRPPVISYRCETDRPAGKSGRSGVSPVNHYASQFQPPPMFTNA
jgi:hypothetical protein